MFFFPVFPPPRVLLLLWAMMSMWFTLFSASSSFSFLAALGLDLLFFFCSYSGTRLTNTTTTKRCSSICSPVPPETLKFL